MQKNNKTSVKQQIVDAFNMALKEKPLNKITVTDIMNCGGMTRQMFYRYFKDIDEVIFYIHQTRMLCFADEFWDGTTFIASFEGYLNAIYENKKYYKSLIKSDSINSFPNFFCKLMSEYMETFIQKYKRHSVTEEDRFAIEFYWKGATAQLVDWINNDMKTTPTIMAKRFYMCLPPSLLKHYEI